MIPGALSPEIESVKTRFKHIWMAGDYDRFSRYMEGGAREPEKSVARLAPRAASPQNQPHNTQPKQRQIGRLGHRCARLGECRSGEGQAGKRYEGKVESQADAIFSTVRNGLRNRCASS